MNCFYLVSVCILLNCASEIKCWRDDDKDYEDLNRKYRQLASEKNRYLEHFMTFLRLIEKTAIEDVPEQVLSLDLTLTRQEVNDITSAINSGTYPSHVISLLGKVRPRYSWTNWSSRILNTITDLVQVNKTLSYILAITLSVFLLLIYWLHISKSWFSACLKMFVLVFSVVVTTFRKYEEQLVKKKVFLQNGVPLSCRPQDQSIIYSMWSFVKSFFTVQEDECLKYYEAELIDPLLGFTLSEAVSETFTKFILTPFPIIFEYLGQSIRKFFQVLPPFLWIPGSIMVTIFYLIHSRYRVRTILGSLEPADNLSYNQTSLPWNRWLNSPMNAFPVEQDHSQRNMVTGGGNNIQIMFGDDTKSKMITLKETALVPEMKLDFLKQDQVAVTGNKPLCLPTTETQNKIEINFGGNCITIFQGQEEGCTEPNMTRDGLKVPRYCNTSGGSIIGTQDSKNVMPSSEIPNSSAKNEQKSSGKVFPEDLSMLTGSRASATERGATSSTRHLMRNIKNKFVIPIKEKCYNFYVHSIHPYARKAYRKAQNWNEIRQMPLRLFSFLKKHVLMLRKVIQMYLSKTRARISVKISRRQLYSEPKTNTAADEQCSDAKKTINRCENELPFELSSTQTESFCPAENNHSLSDHGNSRDFSGSVDISNCNPNNRLITSYKVLKEKWQEHLAFGLSFLFFGIHQKYAKTLIQGINARSEVQENQARSHEDNSSMENYSVEPSLNFRSRLIALFYVLHGGFLNLFLYFAYHIRDAISCLLVGFQLVGELFLRAYYNLKMAVMYIRLSIYNCFVANAPVIAHAMLYVIAGMMYSCISFMLERLIDMV